MFVLDIILWAFRAVYLLVKVALLVLLSFMLYHMIKFCVFMVIT